MAERTVNCNPCSSRSSYSPAASSSREPTSSRPTTPSPSRRRFPDGAQPAQLQQTPINLCIGQLNMSVDMPASILPQEIESACTIIQRQPEEIMCVIFKTFLSYTIL